ncbi:unnamed protein product, partial [Scytosiphon promiscuus]
FSFFEWIFIPKNQIEENLSDNIIKHEQINASQFHSIDLIMIELMLVVMWFNPLVWRMKKSIQLVHEYLADEGVLHSGADKLRYQALLINQVAEDRLICISSSFNDSLIKKRINMMTKNKFDRGPRFNVLTIIPITIFLIIGIASLNGQELNKNSIPITVVVDAGHGGKDLGRVNGNIAEKNLTLSLIKILKAKASSNTNLNLIFTRENDELVTFQERITTDADLLISIHVNSANNTDLSGIECFIARDSKFKNEKFGEILISELSQLNGIETRKSLTEANFLVLKES